ncbi:helix-turn-helix domain-containing protein [Microbacterium sp. P01]|uniref:helix-turn-helix domain-containing protein n=1 Tax=Microbacterium sp. P01 TaxID=3366261 RepID=UPI0036724F8D
MPSIAAPDARRVDGDEHGTDAAARRLGAHIRRLRQARRLTLVRLASATELSHPFLSQLERGLAQPSLASLRRIAVALGTSPIELIAAADAPASGGPAVEVHRRGDGALSADFAVGTARMLAGARRPFHPMEYHAENVDPGDSFAHDEDEFVYVLSGSVCMEVDGAVSVLSPSDSAYYAGGVAHRWWSEDGRPYRLLVVKQRP